MTEKTYNGAKLADLPDGVFFDMPETVYHAIPRLSASGIQNLRISAGTFWAKSWMAPEKELDDDQTKAQIYGKAAHCARLEPERFAACYARAPHKDDYAGVAGFIRNATQAGAALGQLGEAKTKAGEGVFNQCLRLEAAGYAGPIFPLIEGRFYDGLVNSTIPRVGLDAKFYDEIERDTLLLHSSQGGTLLAGGQAEVTILYTVDGIRMKSRLDYLTVEHWTDAKTFANPQGKPIEQCISNAVQYNRLYIQAAVYREAVEAIRSNASLPVIGDATDDQRELVAVIATSEAELDCWFVFQEKGIPNILAKKFRFYDVPLNTEVQTTGARDPDGMRAATATVTNIFRRATAEIRAARKMFTVYQDIYEPGQPWMPFNQLGEITDNDFPPYWLDAEI